ncbi:protein trichome birefringence-like 14 isoform X1 [Silene latifolia]|uniref:protein trichome birefringence-like 14 isoform X1 n=1 Tax=Silene latifolia TaxID=37657 RepID=UPI003D7898E9
MKGGLLALRSTKVAFVLVTLICTTFVIWGWDKTPFIVSLIPENQFFKISPDIFIGSPTKKTSDEVNKDTGNYLISPAIKEIAYKPNEKAFDVEAPNKDANNVLLSPAINETAYKHNEKVLDVEAPNSSPTKHDKRPNRVCNYAKGKWVEDDHRPFYSGGRCRQWLSEMWACRVTDRTDFSFEKFRWQPDDCEMDEFSGIKFLRRMRNKTLAFIGDSLGRQQFQSLMCMVSGGKERRDVIDVGWEYGLVKARGALRPDGWAYRFTRTNATILFYWSACLCDLQKLNPSDSKSEVAMHLDRPPAFLRQFLDKFDILVLNTGHHWNRGKLDANHWVMHVGGIPTPDKNMLEAKNLAIASVVKWVDSQLPYHPNLKAFYRSISPRHFFNGDWNSGGTCDNMNPLSKGKEVLKEESADPAAAKAVKGTNVTLLDITALSELRDEGHISKYSIRPSPGMQDCLHWCLPGVPDTWNEILFAQLPTSRKKLQL